MEETKWGVGEEICSVASGYPEYCLGRILSQGKEWYRLLTEKGEYSARISGKFRYETISICEYPAVGDFVLAKCHTCKDTVAQG